MSLQQVHNDIIENLQEIESLVTKELYKIGYSESDLAPLNESSLIVKQFIIEFDKLKEQNKKLIDEKKKLMEILMTNINN